MKNIPTFEEFINESEENLDSNENYKMSVTLGVDWAGRIVSDKYRKALDKNNVKYDVDTKDDAFKHATGNSRNRLWRVELSGKLSDLKAAWKDMGFSAKNFPTGSDKGLHKID
jgi:hypothetical protein